MKIVGREAKALPPVQERRKKMLKLEILIQLFNVKDLILYWAVEQRNWSPMNTSKQQDNASGTVFSFLNM